MTQEITQEERPNCPVCLKSVLPGQVIYAWNDEADTHVNCDDPYSLDVEPTEDGNPPLLLLGSPMRYSRAPKDAEQAAIAPYVEVLRECHKALRSLPDSALGWGKPAFCDAETAEASRWPLRDELIAKIDNLLAEEK